MNRDDIRLRVQGILSEIIDDPELLLMDETTAEDVIDWDSANHMKLILALEVELKIRFEPDEIASPENVGDLLDTIAAKL
jgi:acyl carrier protein